MKRGGKGMAVQASPREGDLVKAKPRRGPRNRQLFGALTVGKKQGYAVNGIAVKHQVEVLEGNDKRLLRIFLKTEGHCHFCGDELDFEKRGWDADLTGRWEVDHVIQRKKKGASRAANYLPACTRCNRLRWSRTGASLRRVIFLGLIAKDEAYYNPGSSIGGTLRELRIERLAENWRRRIRKSFTPDEYKRRVATIPQLILDMKRFESRALERYRRALDKQRKGRAEVASVELDLGKPRKSHISWSDMVEAVRRDPHTPDSLRKAERILRE
jgi:hypothetical protein